MSVTRACAWCRRETVNGIPTGAPLPKAKYAAATHGHCLDCNEDFEAGFTAEVMLSRARSRVLRAVPM